MIIKVYQGYGHTHDLIIYGHVLKRQPAANTHYSNNILVNLFYLLRLFFVKPFPQTRVRLQWGNQQLTGLTNEEGFIKFEWASEAELAYGWHTVTLEVLNDGAPPLPAVRAGYMYRIAPNMFLFQISTIR